MTLTSALAALGEHLVEQRQVVDPGVARSTGSSRPTAMASSADPCSDEAIGSSVNSRCSQAPAMVASARRLVVTFSMPSLTTCWAAAASLVGLVDRLAEAGDEVADDVGVLLEELGGDDQVGRHELAVGPQLGLVDEHVPPPSLTRRVAHGSGTHAPSMAPDWNAASVSALSCGVICTSPPPLVSVSKPCSLSQARRATSWVLPSDGVASVVPARSAGESMPSRTTSEAPPDVVPATMRSASPPGLGVAVDRRVGADEAGVEGAGEQRLDDLGAGVERRQLQRDVGAERLGEQAGLDADDRRGVGDVREVAEPQRDARARRCLRRVGRLVRGRRRRHRRPRRATATRRGRVQPESR